MSRRSDKISITLKKAISDIIAIKLQSEFDSLVTISEVKITPDLSDARIFVSVMGNINSETKIIRILNKNTALFKNSIGQYIKLRRIPSIKFLLDSTLENAQRIQELIDEVKS